MSHVITIDDEVVLNALFRQLAAVFPDQAFSVAGNSIQHHTVCRSQMYCEIVRYANGYLEGYQQGVKDVELAC